MRSLRRSKARFAPNRRGPKHSTRQPDREVTPEPLTLGSDEDALLEELKRRLARAFVTIEDERTFWEWLRGYDPAKDPRRQAEFSRRQAHNMVEHRQMFLQKATQLTKARCDAEVARIEAQIRIQKARLDLARIEEEISRLEQLKEQRLPGKDRSREISGTVAPVVVNPIVEAHRQKLQTALKTRQAELTDFLEEVRSIASNTELPETDKVQMVRVTMEEYRRNEDMLPPEVQELLDRVEGNEDGRC